MNAPKPNAPNSRPNTLLNTLDAWAKLGRHAKIISQPENHLRHLITQENRLQKFSLSQADVLYDFSRQRLNQTTLDLLLELADKRAVQGTFSDMARGVRINTTENRPALHTASRSFSDQPIMIDDHDVMVDIVRVRREIRQFTRDIDEQKITGATGKPFTHLVVIGIGGSYLGTEFVARALSTGTRPKRALHFLSNVDIHNFGNIVSAINPEETLWIIVSKSFTTAETMANANLARDFMEKKGLDPKKHFIAITSKGSPGDMTANPSGGNSTTPTAFPVMRAFHMFDFIGGRYSVTSAVGGVPLSLYLGYDQFERFLKGAEAMDQHARTAPAKTNMPLLAALISIWNNNFLGYTAQAVIPYASPLDKLAPHVQQLYMESCGKSVTRDGDPATERTGVLIFGEPGTNAQHSFFQLAHQGHPFPIDFIGVIHPRYQYDEIRSRGVTNHEELWANLIAQPLALATGKDDPDPHKCFSGNRPSSTIILKDLSPESVGKLLAFYEARTVFEAFIWGINPFDQFGVELGKTLATNIRSAMAARHTSAEEQPKPLDHFSDFYINLLRK